MRKTLITALFAFVCGLFYQKGVAIVNVRQKNRRISFSLSMSAAGSAMLMVKKGKLKETEALLSDVAAAGGSHIISQFLKDGSRPQGVGDPYNFVQCALVSHGALSVMPEYNKKTKTGFIMGMPPPEIMGGVLRDAGARSIIISLDKRSGGATVEEFERFTREQTKARRMMPAPIPIVWHDFIVSSVQITYAAALGAAAVTLTPSLCDEKGKGENDLESLVAHSKKMGIEPIGKQTT